MAAPRHLLYLPAAEVERLAEPAAILAAVRAALEAHGRGETVMPPKIYLDLPQGDLRAMPAYLPGLCAAAIKLINVHPGNPARGLPSVIGLVVLYDPETGAPTALLDGTLLTALRTGAAAAVATDLLARPEAHSLGLFGAGAQAISQVGMCARVRRLDRVLLCDIDEARAAARAREIEDRLGLRCRVAPAEEAAACDIVNTATTSTRPFLRRAWVRPGAHVNAVGADAKGKQEVDVDLVAAARVFCDDRRQAAHSGEIQHALAAGRIRLGDVAEIGEVLAGRRPGRSLPDEITLFDTTGLAIFDVAAAATVVARARAAGAGTEITL